MLPSPHRRRSGELYPVETDTRLCEELETGREVRGALQLHSLVLCWPAEDACVLLRRMANRPAAWAGIFSASMLWAAVCAAPWIANWCVSLASCHAFLRLLWPQVEVDMEADVLTDLTTGKKYSLKPLGDVSTSWGWGCQAARVPAASISSGWALPVALAGEGGL